MNPTSLAARYFESVRNRDLDGLMALFAPDAVAILPDGKDLPNIEAIRGMYTYLFGANSPVPAAKAVVAGAASVAVEIEASLPDGTVRNTANFFYLTDNGLISRLSIYKRGTW